ncbi:methyl-accepting chemotaxis protein [Hydrogenophaga sp. OTU3427]|uniref:methyl-accepting chemotaxis protein n=1 Tax=Hydrogenophaga sp. OTU3427 TaxID=3043856 RepID=UPI00313B32F4
MLLQKLSLSRKFVVLGLMALLMAAIPTTLQMSRSLADIHTAQRAVRGMAPLMALQKVVQFAQQHRGLSAGMLNGNEAMKGRRPGARDKVNQAVSEVDRLLAAAGADPTATAHWTERKQRWAAIEAAVAAGQLSAADSTREHSQFIASVMGLTGELMDGFGLTLDPDMATHRLIRASFVSAPWLTEKLGVMRAMGSGFLTQGQLPPQGKGTLMGLRDRVTELHDETMNHLGVATALSPSFEQALKAPAQALKAQVGQTLALADQQLINATELNLPATTYFDEFTRTIDAVYQFNGQAMAVLQDELARRVRGLYLDMAWVLGAQLALLLAAIGVAVLFVRSITVPVRHAVRVATAVAQGDLTVPCPPHGSNEIGQLLAALAAMQHQLSTLVATVRADAEGVATASTQIAEGNHDLSARTEQAASALEQTAASMAELNSHVHKNADHAREANQLAQQAQDIAVRGGAVVHQVVNTMGEINDASRRIADIIGVIDGIAFQTNILALNAAVEAARAGEQGRGFAVVAGEVRSLAQRSAGAAREIKDLIQASVLRVDQGSALVQQAGATMDEVVSSIRRVTGIMSDISAASVEQSTGVAQVGEAVSLMDQATQQNAALVEEMAAAASGLSSQAGQLVRAVSVFRTDDSDNSGLLQLQAPRRQPRLLALS